VIVATDGLYRLVYQPSRKTGPIVQTGWSGYGPHGSRITGADETKIIVGLFPACFQQYTRSIHSFASPSQ
jgi:hypothetical protein